MARDADWNYIHIMFGFITEMVVIFFCRLSTFVARQRGRLGQFASSDGYVDKGSRRHLLGGSVLFLVLCAPRCVFLSTMLSASVFYNTSTTAFLALRKTTIRLASIFVEFGQWQQFAGAFAIFTGAVFVGSCFGMGRIRGILRHDISSFVAVSKPRIVTSNRSALSIGPTGVYCITKRRIIQVDSI